MAAAKRMPDPRSVIRDEKQFTMYTSRPLCLHLLPDVCYTQSFMDSQCAKTPYWHTFKHSFSIMW